MKKITNDWKEPLELVLKDFDENKNTCELIML